MGERSFRRDRKSYEDRAIVALYGDATGLQPPEETILARLKPELAGMDMLDLGVGGGRTTPHFAPFVRSYLGVDYSRPMIEHCRRKLPAFRFDVHDARNLDFAADASFDFVLFSYNGIDHVDRPDRLRVLHEMRRVLRPGGLMVFSSHNANNLAHAVEGFRFGLKPTLRETLSALKWSVLGNLHNPALHLRPLPSEGRFADGANDFRTAPYYIRPDLQLDALRSLGMHELRCAGGDRHDFLEGDDARVGEITSPWIYYACRKPAARDESRQSG